MTLPPAGDEAGKPRKRGRPALPPEHQRQRLLDAAEQIFERNRYEHTTVQQIFREAGMSSRTFYEFFDSKEQLVADLARERAEPFMADLERELDSVTDMLETIDRLLMAFLERLPVVLVELERMGGPAGKAVRAVRTEYRDRMRDMMMRRVVVLYEAGLFKQLPTDPMPLELILAGIESIVIGARVEGRREDLLALHPRLLSAVQQLMAGYIA